MILFLLYLLFITVCIVTVALSVWVINNKKKSTLGKFITKHIVCHESDIFKNK